MMSSVETAWPAGFPGDGPRDMRPPMAISRLRVKDEHAFNAGFIRSNDGALLMIYRRGLEPERLSVCWFDGSFRSLPRDYADWDLYNNYDARLLYVGEQLYMSTTYGWYERTAPNGRSRIDWNERTELWPLIVSGSAVTPMMDERVCFDGVHDASGRFSPRKRNDKNWTFFGYGDGVFGVRSISPHEIIEVDLFGRRAIQRFSCPWALGAWPSQCGTELRGNTSPVALDDRTCLSVFHTVSPGGDYYTGFYTFERCPPFRVTGASPVPVIGPEHTTGANWRRRDRRIRCIFLCGLFVEDGMVHACGGDNDHSIVVVSMPLSDLLRSLVPVG